MDYFALAADLARQQARSPFREEPTPEPEYCWWCTIAPTDPRYWPYCSPACAGCARED